jgi:hypothetical protein
VAGSYLGHELLPRAGVRLNVVNLLAAVPIRDGGGAVLAVRDGAPDTPIRLGTGIGSAPTRSPRANANSFGEVCYREVVISYNVIEVALPSVQVLG